MTYQKSNNPCAYSGTGRRRIVVSESIAKCIRYGSLFSGIEAATLAFEPLGWKAALVRRNRPLLLQGAYQTLARSAEPWRRFQPSVYRVSKTS